MKNSDAVIEQNIRLNAKTVHCTAVKIKIFALFAYQCLDLTSIASQRQASQEIQG